jgi:hypothetical protein
VQSVAIQPNTEKLTDWHSCWFGEGKRTGYVTVTDFCFQKSYGAKDIKALINDTFGIKSRFVSLNAFTFGERQSIHLKQIRNVGIDLDQYKKGLSIDQGLDALQALILEKKIPEPNLVLTSRGIQLFYTIKGGAASKMSWLSSFITEQYISKLRHIGADGNAKDVSRVMRVPYSVNERNGEIVKPEIWNPYPYTLQELQAYCKPLDNFGYKGKKKAEIKRIIPNNLSFFYKTNYIRLTDLDTLIGLRNGDFTGKRNLLIYIYAYHQALICSSLADTESFMLNVLERIHSKTDKPMSKTEFKRTVRSAYEDSKKFFDHFKANGFKVVYKLNDGIIKPYKTTSLIDKLDITTDEQRALHRMHTGIVSKEKDAERKCKERRSAGMKSMQEYNEQRKEQTEDKLLELQRILNDSPKLSNRKIANLMGISESYVRKLKVRTHVSL